MCVQTESASVWSVGPRSVSSYQLSLSRFTYFQAIFCIHRGEAVCYNGLQIITLRQTAQMDQQIRNECVRWSRFCVDHQVSTKASKPIIFHRHSPRVAVYCPFPATVGIVRVRV